MVTCDRTRRPDSADLAQIDDLHLVVAVRVFRGRPLGLDDAAALEPVLEHVVAGEIGLVVRVVELIDGKHAVGEQQFPAGLLV